MVENQDEKSSDNKDEDILAHARERLKIAEDAWQDIRRLSDEDHRFVHGEQWPEGIKLQRQQEQRPCLTINRLPQSIRQVTNDQRQNRPSIKVSPVDDGADKETAKVFQGLIRHIEVSSNADVAYDTAFQGAVKGGYGHLRVVTDYCDPMSFNQDIKIKRLRNRNRAVLDPNHQEPDGSDANWGFVVEDIEIEDFKSQYKNSKFVETKAWELKGAETPFWMTDRHIRVAEYFYKEFEEIEIVLVGLPDGSTKVIPKKDLPEELPEDLKIVGERKTVLPAIKWCKINGGEILEKTDWPGLWIPIIPVYGDEEEIDGELHLEGMVRHAKDPQRMYNYWATSATETIALAPRAPFIGVEGQFKGHEEKWRTANIKSHAYLEYKPTSNAGVPTPPPARNVYEPPVAAISNERALSADDLKATTGIYDASLGNRSNENSGVAIQRRNMQAQTSNFHFVDNLARSMRHLGRILIDLIPKIYDTPRAIRILGEGDEPQIVTINQIFKQNGVDKKYDLSVGKYDVVVETGPSYATKRQEAAETMLEFTKAIPTAAPIIADLMVKNMDWPGASEIAERLKKTLPPGMAEEKDGEKMPVPPEAQQALQQQGQMIEALTQQLNEYKSQAEIKKQEFESKERIEAMKLKTQAEIEMMKVGSVEAIELLRQDVARLGAELAQSNREREFENEERAALAAQSTGGQTPG